MSSEVAVHIQSECIMISDHLGEIVYWDASEWNKDGSLTPCIANAIKIAYTEGPGKLRELLREGKNNF